MKTYLFVGGLVALGFDRTGSYLLTVSHSGRGVFRMPTWERVARDYELSYPENGVSVGIGPIEGELVPVAELDSNRPLEICSPDGRFVLVCESSAIEVTSATDECRKSQ